MSTYISQKEMAKKFNKTKNTIALWVRKGFITPVNSDTYRSDGGYRFDVEEYERVCKIFTGDMLFLGDAAKEVGVSPQYLSTLANADPPQIPSQLFQYGKQMRRVFRRADCKALREVLAAKGSTQYYKEVGGLRLKLFKDNVRLFASFNYGGKKTVVVRVEPIRLLSVDGYVNLKDGELLPFSNEMSEVPYKYEKRGFMFFTFPKSEDPHSPNYDMLYRLIEALGQRNIAIFERETEYYVRCRLGRFRGNHTDLQLLEKYKVEGSISFHDGVIELEGESICKTTSYQRSLYDRIIALSNEEKSFDDWVNELLYEALSKRDLDK
ncbi:hypothetical protein SAMN04487897_1692 [Paenibacillus sp. yr247]|uniref:hypothetical protein n=1 Tax=Paenibacillus sp. yr247 TaxID=1761880 RepID=UPI0008915B40|nr:hypothetical protein [Paenibacillus sp. yr247]SDP29661.1 hypothetical protein SAMN04487897_1692 [Paenibacillus sp. yr247]